MSYLWWLSTDMKGLNALLYFLVLGCGPFVLSAGSIPSLQLVLRMDSTQVGATDRVSFELRQLY